MANGVPMNRWMVLGVTCLVGISCATAKPEMTAQETACARTADLAVPAPSGGLERVGRALQGFGMGMQGQTPSFVYEDMQRRQMWAQIFSDCVGRGRQ